MAIPCNTDQPQPIKKKYVKRFCANETQKADQLNPDLSAHEETIVPKPGTIMFKIRMTRPIVSVQSTSDEAQMGIHVLNFET